MKVFTEMMQAVGGSVEIIDDINDVPQAVADYLRNSNLPAHVRRGPQAEKKDTLANIEATGEFVVNVVDEDFVAAMNQCSADYAPDESEFVASGLTPVPSEVVAPPRVAESPIAMECKLHQVVEVSAGPGGGSLVLGTVVRMHVRDDLYENGKILTNWHPVGRMAGATYVRTRDTFELPRPTLEAKA